MNSLEEQLDLRVRRTHKLLWEALMSLMSERDFETISVKDICGRAMVHRTTFYKHYEDKYDLLLRGMREMHASLKEEIKLPEDALTGEGAPPSLLRMFMHVAKHEQFYRLMLCGDGIATFYTLLRNYLAEHCESYLHKLERAGKKFVIPLPILAQFSAGAVISTIAWWLEHDLPYPPEQMARYMGAMLNDNEGRLALGLHRSAECASATHSD